MLFTKEQKSDFIIAFFWVEGEGGEGGGGRYDNIHFFLGIFVQHWWIKEAAWGGSLKQIDRAQPEH